MNRLLFTSLLLALFSPLWLSAQRTITGTVTDFDSKRNRPLAGVAVSVEGAAAITRTDEAGKYTLKAPANAKALLFNLGGYASVRVELTTSNTYDIALKRSSPAPRPEDEDDARLTLLPVDTIPVALLLNTYGQIELSQVLQFSSSLFNSNRQTLAGASDHVDPVQLRGLGSDQMLVLVNGKRWHQSALVHTGPTAQRGMSQGFDWGAIPASAVERIEVSRDVALGQYGSDAVAGVVNIILKNKPGALDAQLSYGQRMTTFDRDYALWKYGAADQPDTRVSDGQTVHAGLHYGIDLGEKGRLGISGEYLSRGATERSGTYTGKIFSFNVQDSLILAQTGRKREEFVPHIGEARMRGGAALFDLDLSLTDEWQFYAVGSFSQKNGRSTAFYHYPSVIESEAQGSISLALQTYPFGFLPEINSRNRNLGASLGLRGNAGGWLIDLSNTTGHNKLDFDVDHTINYSEYVTQTLSPQTSFDAGGLHLFQNTARLDVSRQMDNGAGVLHLGAGLEHRIERYGIRQGELYAYSNQQHLNLPTLGSQGFTGFDDSTGTHGRSSIGAYLAADQQFGETFRAGGTLRFDRYAGAGNALGGKLMLHYRPTPAFSVHAAAGLGFRAPSVQQRFFNQPAELYYYNFDVVPPPGRSGIFANNAEVTQIFEVGDLKPETSLGFSAGITVQPADGLEFTLDAWQLSVNDRMILTYYLTQGINGAIDSAMLALGAREVSFWDNAIDTRSFGVEAGFSWKKMLDERQKLQLGLNAGWNRSKIKTDANGLPALHLPQIAQQNDLASAYFNLSDQNRIEGALPHIKLIASAEYEYEGIGAALRASWWGSTQYRDPFDARGDNLFGGGEVELLNQEFGSKTLLDLSVFYTFSQTVKITLGAHNLLDAYPDRHTHSQNTAGGLLVYNTQAQQFGFAGRMLFARVSCAF